MWASAFKPSSGVLHFKSTGIILDDQTQVDSKPAGQPEQASLNQCQLITANSPKLVLCASQADSGDKVSL